ncbi:hypothetical protein [Oceaniserpentilla sp. 4NH20-0058]|uniref:hypothetical protein n=1 Tax=Oceaniserpentilla sp. 4NH20-0058 TaxID=3127660 RepID=UPI00334084A0
MKSLQLHKSITAFTLLLCACISSYANENEIVETHTEIEEISIPLSAKNIKQNSIGPTRGTSMNTVKQTYGEPIKVHPAKGKPPITRWDYPTFSAFFESKSLIHTVNRSN